MSGPLQGVRVLDLTRLLPGGYATLLLADLGADVVKVEEPGRGDYVRWMPPLVDGVSTFHRALNRGKRSVALDLKSPEGAAALRRLAASADGVVESYRPGVLDRLGVGYERLSAERPGLVWCAISGYGQEGPYRDRAGHDINYVGYAGLLSASGAAGGPPVLPPVQVGDLAGGMGGALGVVAAVLEARATGRGRMVDVSLLDMAMSWMPIVMGTHLGGDPVERGRMYLTGGLACYRVYRCADGKWLSVGALEPQFWRTLCEALEAPELVDLHLAPGQEELALRLQAIFAERPRDEWVERLAGLDACVGPVLDVADAMDDPQVRARGMVAEVGGEPVGPGPAIKAGGEGALRPAPGLGEHTAEVLGEAGFSVGEIDALEG